MCENSWEGENPFSRMQEYKDGHEALRAALQNAEHGDVLEAYENAEIAHENFEVVLAEMMEVRRLRREE